MPKLVRLALLLAAALTITAVALTAYGFWTTIHQCVG